MEVLSRQPLPLEKPPPLPPKKLEQVLNSEALANDNIKAQKSCVIFAFDFNWVGFVNIE